jgi:cholesterol transport system auxiliary component
MNIPTPSLHHGPGRTRTTSGAGRIIRARFDTAPLLLPLLPKGGEGRGEEAEFQMLSVPERSEGTPHPNPLPFGRGEGAGGLVMVRPIILIVLACLLGGCLSRPHLQTQTFVFGLPTAPPSNPNPALKSHRVVAIRSLRVAAPFDGRSLVYRTGENSYQADPYAEFLVSPSESILLPIRSRLRETGSFEDVVEPGSARKPNTMAEIAVLQLYGDFRRSGEPAAQLMIRFVLLDSPNGVPGNAIFQREYSRRIPLKTRTAPALMAGWDEALAQILDQLNSDLRSLAPAPDA